MPMISALENREPRRESFLAPVEQVPGWIRGRQAQPWLTFIAICTAMLAIVLVPTFVATYPGLIDYPNHLARIHLLSRLPEDMAYGRFYAIHGALQPNLAMDIIALALVRIGVPIEIAGGAFTAMCIAILCLGTIAIAWVVQDKPPWTALPVFAIVFNINLTMGFLNYIFGMGLALIVLAIWLRYNESVGWVHVVVLSFLAIALLLCHLMAFAVFGAAVLAAAVQDCWSTRASGLRYRPALRALAVLLPGALAYAVLFEHAGRLDLAFDPTFRTKLFGLLGIIYSHGLWWDGLLPGAAIVTVVVMRRRVQLSFANATVRFILFLLALLYLLAPFAAMGSWYLDTRLAVPLVCCAIAFVRVDPLPSARSTLAVVLLVCLSALVVQRSLVVASDWREASRHFAQVRQALNTVPAGTSVATLLRKARASGPESPPMRYAAALGLLDKALLIPNLFAYPFNGQLIEFKPACVEYIRPYTSATQFPGPPDDWVALSRSFDYVLIQGSSMRQQPPAYYRLVAEGPYFELWATSLPPDGDTLQDSSSRPAAC